MQDVFSSNKNNTNISITKTGLVLGIFCSIFYVSSSIFGNILSTKISYIPLINLEFDAGTIIYPLAFISRDMIHKMLGKFVANSVVLLNGFFIMLMAILFYLGSLLPSSSSWANQEAYNLILTPVSRIIIASIISEIIANLLNSAVFSSIIKKNSKLDVVASITSNSFAVFIDSIVFSFIAFLFVMPINVVIEIILANFLIKGLVAIVFSPLIRLTKYNTNKDLL